MITSRVIEVPLGLEVRFAGGGQRKHDFSALRCQRLALPLVRAHGSLIAPRGSIASVETSSCYATSIMQFVRGLEQRGFDGGPRDLKPEHVSALVSGQSAGKSVLFIKRLLRQIEAAAPASLPPDVLAIVATPTYLDSSKPPLQPVAPLTHGETERLEAACKREIAELEERLAEGAARIAEGRDPRGNKWPTEPDILWLLDAMGPQRWHQIRELCGFSNARSSLKLLGRPYPDVVRLLYPSRRDLVPYALMFGLRTGLPPESITGLKTDDLDRVGDGKVILRWIKARAMGAEAGLFRAVGQWSPGGLFDRVLAVTERTRRYTAPAASGRLWLGVETSGEYAFSGYMRPRAWNKQVRQFIADHDLRDDNGLPLRLDRRALRKVHYAKADKAFAGMVNVIAGPNQSPQVAGDHYLAAVTSTETVERVIEAAQHDMLRKARSKAMIVSTEQMAHLTDDRDRAGEVLGLDPGKAATLLTTEQEDVSTAKCKDFEDAPHGTTGEPCHAPDWQCLMCENAVITPSKLPNLLSLLDFVDSQHESMPALEWERHWGGVERILRLDVLPAYTDDEQARARSRATPIDLYVSPENRAS